MTDRNFVEFFILILIPHIRSESDPEMVVLQRL